MNQKECGLTVDPEQGPETKAQRFNRLATCRVKKVVRALRILANCSNRAAYEYTQAEVDAMFQFIEDQAREAKARFRRSRDPEFRFPAR